MLAKRLEVVHYQDQWANNIAIVRDPTFLQIEEAIRRLDRFHYPWVWLRLTDVDGDELGRDDNYMTIMGGDGAFWLAISVDGYDQRRLLYNDQGSEEVEVWKSDQGFGDERRRICFDLGAVVRGVKYFAENWQL